MGSCGSKSGGTTPAAVANKFSAASDDTAASGAGAPAAAKSPVARAVDEARSSGVLDLSAKSGLRATQIPDVFDAAAEILPTITEVSLKEQRLTEFPTQLLKCSALTSLDLNQNALSALPETFGSDFPKLVVLDISENTITQLPDSLCNLTSLKNFIAFKNKLFQLPDSFGNLAALEEMNVFNNNLIRLPASLTTCTSMKDFNAAANKLKTLPKLDGWTQVTRIAVFGNTLVMLPSLAGVTANLEQLQLQDNPLTEVPELGTAPKLALLDMNSCQLAAVDPARLTALTAVTNFNLKGNQLAELPEGISAMQSLEILNVGANQLTGLPSGLAQCPALKVVLINNNLLEQVPPVLLQVSTIQRVMFKGCPVAGSESPEMEQLEGVCKRNKGWVR